MNFLEFGKALLSPVVIASSSRDAKNTQNCRTLWSAGSSSLPECDPPEREFLKLLSKGGKQFRNLVSDPDPVPGWDITSVLCTSIVIPGSVS